VRHVQFIVPSLNQRSMHNLSHTKARCLTDTPTRSGACRRHLQAVQSQMLTFQHIKYFQATVRPLDAETQPSLAIRYF